MPLLHHSGSHSKIATRSIRYCGKNDSAISTAACLLCVLSGTTSTSIQALEFQCEGPDDTRTLSVDIPGEEHLCEVAVTDAQTGIRDVKWYADSDSLFCSARGYEMRDKYEQSWNYTCSKWPDLNGIDGLSPSQRLILDQRLKVLTTQGLEAVPPFTITGLRAVASTPLNEEAGKLAFQFFRQEANGADTDFTEIIEDEVQSWRVITTVDSLLTQLNDIGPDGSALINGITADGDLRVHSTFTNDEDSLCYGSQILSSDSDSGDVTISTPHRYLCRSDSDEATTITGVRPDEPQAPEQQPEQPPELPPE